MSDVDPPDVAVFTWGNGHEGQLGLGGMQEQLLLPATLQFANKTVRNIVCGDEHTLFEADGILSCGNNDLGQLGHGKSRSMPGAIEVLNDLSFSQLGAGQAHSVALTDSGTVFAWGSNEYGQLGRGRIDEEYSVQPKIVKTLSPLMVIQVACGKNHCLALTNYGKLYAWGDNHHGQLGIGNHLEAYSNTPLEISCVSGLTIRQIAAGGHHSFLLTVSGALYGWGKNRFGQLGVGDDISDQHYPKLVKTLRSQAVRYVSCGEDHTAVITKDGGMFTFGAGMYGQLGHNSKQHEFMPRKVFELMGSTVTQVACGRHHTLALVGSSGRVYSFGLGANGQLGVGVIDTMRTSPSMVKGPFVPVMGKPSSMPINMDNQSPYIVRQIVAGGDQCFTIGISPNTTKVSIVPIDMRLPVTTCQQVATLDEERLVQYSGVASQHHPDSDLLEDLEKTFSSLSCHNGSFLIKDDDSKCSSTHSGVDLEVAMDYYARLANLSNTKITKAIFQSFEKGLIPSLVSSPPDVEALRVYLTLPCCQAFDNPKNFHSIICPFTRAVNNLNDLPSKVVGSWWSRLHTDYFLRFIQMFSKTVLYILNLPQATSQIQVETRGKNILSCLNVLKKLNQVNDQREDVLPVERFYIDELQDKIDVKMDYIRWLQTRDSSRCPAQGDTLTLCNFPFVFNAQAKTQILQTDAILQMQFAVEEANRHNLSSIFIPTIDPINPCLILYINRNSIVQDTITQISKTKGLDLKKPLKVMFMGEEALDAGGVKKVIFLGEEALDKGGVKKEFFLLILREILDPKYGMFKHYEESRLLWFQQQSFEEDNQMFILIGVLCGLAIYNATIIDLHFPLALYKKLLDKPITLDDLKELDSSIHRSLVHLLEYEGDDVEDVFGLSFQVTQEAFGEVMDVPLIKDGGNIAVTKENKQEYVNTYIDYLFNTSIKDQFKAFSDGFLRVCGGRVLQLFHPKELQAMVIGNENYDWTQFEEEAEYKPEYRKDHPTIIYFWEVFRELDHGQKKQFLLFLTGSDRIPVYGMKAVKMTIQPTGGGNDFLPCAHTCFNLLDLPKYDDKAVLRSKLVQAIHHCQGFGLV